MEKNIDFTEVSSIKFGKAVIAGLIGTLAMTIVMLMAPLMGMPPMPIGKMLAGFMDIPEVLGWIAHFMIGTVLALIYVYIFASLLKGNGFVRGAVYGLVPWFVAQIMVNPMMGAGFFAANTPSPFLMVMGSLIGHLVYGAVLGGVYGNDNEFKTVQSKT
ncbi:DUF6789 family protein [Melioribacteraceae bacterium 4301-Me]|uniref:DUF6789 family protein n=1 Tax=Pyranulibacter aquaticus TaxID=3163344 RepID=UPI00359B856B